MSPTKPGVTIEASQQVLIEALPPILVLHMKRFLYDTDAKGVLKIGKMVQFTPELEIGKGESLPYMSRDRCSVRDYRHYVTWAKMAASCAVPTLWR